MGKIVSLINTTPDGFADAQFLIIDDEFHEFADGLLSNADAVAFGRNTFELFQTIWPPRIDNENATPGQRKLARALTDIPKTVYSSTLKTTTWGNSTIAPVIDADQINSYTQADKKGMFIIGSATLIASLTEMNLVDDYYFCIQPVIAGMGGVRLFDKIKLEVSRPLKYVDSVTLKSGVHIIHYQTVN